ncbi:hypothetical protein TcasGA2_TC031850 [Tribolium castaneum]|uniref:Uncharacterized protein n=1 Tax=Tribolium castaneum TaxID=7070 RepID=A0A139W9C0_TRICA|nr:hypothetical protein TcasGA2_TC031850 [Tribolium castaneum]
MVVFVDFQGFNYGNCTETLTIKELAVFNTNKSAPDIFLFKPPDDLSTLPHRYQKQADWLTNNFHGLSWNCGNYDYENMTRTGRGADDGAAARKRARDGTGWRRRGNGRGTGWRRRGDGRDTHTHTHILG